MRTLIYTCTFPDYDQLFSPIEITPGAGYVIYSPQKPHFVRHWTWQPIPEKVKHESQLVANRYCKFFPHILMPEADVTVYIDGSMLILGDLTPMLEEFLASGAPIGLCLQLRQRSYADEAAEALKVGRIPHSDEHLVREQIEKYRREGLPEEFPVTANYIIFRNHTVSDLNEEMELLWSEFMTFTKRDQISLPYVFYKCATKVHYWHWNPTFFDNPYFKLMGHRKRFIHKFTASYHAAKYKLVRPSPDICRRETQRR